MNFKKIVSTVAAAAIAVSTMAFSASAATVKLNESYTGDWKLSASIPRAEFDKFSGDVKVVLTVEVKKADNAVLKPCDVDKGWDAITSSLTSDTAVAKPDGFILVPLNGTTIEFVVSRETCNDLWNNGIAFQVNNVTIKSAELTDGKKQGEIAIISDKDSPKYIAEGKTYEEITGNTRVAAPAETEAPVTEAPADEAAPAEETTVAEETKEVKETKVVKETEAVIEEEDFDDLVFEDDDVAEDAPEVIAPAADPAPVVAATTAPKAGNTAAAVIVSVMAVAGAAAVVSKKRK